MSRRVLKPGGVLLVITHGGPRRRLPLLQQDEFGWKVETRAIAYSSSALFIRLLRAQVRNEGRASSCRRRVWTLQCDLALAHLLWPSTRVLSPRFSVARPASVSGHAGAHGSVRSSRSARATTVLRANMPRLIVRMGSLFAVVLVCADMFSSRCEGADPSRTGARSGE